MKQAWFIGMAFLSLVAQAETEYRCRAEQATGFQYDVAAGRWSPAPAALPATVRLRPPRDEFEIYVVVGRPIPADYLLVGPEGVPEAACSNRFMGRTVPVISCAEGSGGGWFRLHTDTLRFVHYRAGSYIHEARQMRDEIFVIGRCSANEP